MMARTSWGSALVLPPDLEEQPVLPSEAAAERPTIAIPSARAVRRFFMMLLGTALPASPGPRTSRRKYRNSRAIWRAMGLGLRFGVAQRVAQPLAPSLPS